jgi:CBS-domain-containing membrane protein
MSPRVLAVISAPGDDAVDRAALMLAEHRLARLAILDVEARIQCRTGPEESSVGSKNA